jgi:DNA-binding NarL/FixJ family response regulator
MRVALADDSALFRSGIAMLLATADVEVGVQARTGRELLTRLAAGPAPDVVVLDVRMPPTYTDEGIATALQLREEYDSLGVLVLSTYAEPAYAARLLSTMHGGVGYLLKDRVDDLRTLVDALDRVAAGETVIDPDLVRRLVTRQRGTGVFARLTDREREVLEQMAQGRSNAGIARQLHMSVKTVERHIANVMLHLELTPAGDDNRRVQAVLSWLRTTHESDMPPHG